MKKNPKSEIRMTKQWRNPDAEKSGKFAFVENLFRASSFELRHSPDSN